MDPVASLEQLLDRGSLREAVPQGSRVLVGLSGGADSVALLRALLVFSANSDLQIFAVHVNHGLRASAAIDEAMVRDLCSQLQVPLLVRHLAATEKPAQVSPEQHWRQLRYKAFSEALKEINCDFLALGHTADDLAETVLYHIARGTGVNGLLFKFLNTIDNLQVVRPLWHTTRADIETALINVKQEWILDPTNEDIRYSRNLIRHKVIPVLREINPAVVDAIVRLSSHLCDVVNPSSPSVEIECSSLDPVKRMFLLSNALSVQDLAQKLRHFVRNNCDAIMDRRQVDQAIQIISNSKTGTVALRGMLTLVITQDNAWVYKGNQPTDSQLAHAHVSCFGGLFSDLSVPALTAGLPLPAHFPALDGTEWAVASDAPFHAYVRNRKTGEKIGSKRFAKVLIEHKIPWYLRDFLVIVTDTADRILGVAGLPDLNAWIQRQNRTSFVITCTKSNHSA